MKFVNQTVIPIVEKDPFKKIELCARTCYKSEDKITEDSAPKMVASLIKRGHEAMLEHFSFSVKFVVDRGISHELVRHRLASFAQESTRYCNYANEESIDFIIPFYLKYKSDGWNEWQKTMMQAERSYLNMIKLQVKKISQSHIIEALERSVHNVGKGNILKFYLINT
jgi:thymidylate synthase (FAD)